MADPRARARELAALAHLELSAEEAATFGAQLETILGYLRGLQEVDVADTPEYLFESSRGEPRPRCPTPGDVSAEHACSGLREDEVGSSFDADRALAGAPALRGRLIAVPKFKL